MPTIRLIMTAYTTTYGKVSPKSNPGHRHTMSTEKRQKTTKGSICFHPKMSTRANVAMSRICATAKSAMPAMNM